MRLRPFVRKLNFVFVTLFCFESSWANTQGYSFGLEEFRKPMPTAQYIYPSTGRSNLVSVELLGSVAKPGVYYVPENTDLLSLLSLAGGISSSADIKNIVVRKSSPEQWESLGSRYVSARGSSYRVNLEQVLNKGEQPEFSLNSNDFIYVPKDEPLISDDIFRSASVISLVVGSILTAVLISDRARNNR